MRRYPTQKQWVLQPALKAQRPLTHRSASNNRGAEPFRQSRRKAASPDGGNRFTLPLMPSIYETLRADIIVAMKARDNVTTTALRTADAAIKRAEMDTNKPIDDALVLATLRKAVKNMSDANVEFANGGRADLITANENEIRILEKYLPKGLDAARVAALVDEAIKETGAASKKEMGKVISALKKHSDAALIDFAAASKLVQAKLP